MASRVTFVCVFFFFVVLSDPAIGKHLKAVSHYEFIPGLPRWPVGQTHLTYAFDSVFPESFVQPVASSFDEWAYGSGYFTFSRVADIGSSNLKISFKRRNHGDGEAFDGPGNVLAHSLRPPYGILHFDADERWSLGPGTYPDTFDFKSVALHEIGHLLGLDHSQYQDAVMYRSISPEMVKDELTPDDIQGIRALYGVN